jgi:hypothetical protein
MQRILAALLLLLMAAQASAQDAKPYLVPKSTYQILVIGDGIASGMGAGIARMAENDARLLVDGRYDENSGLARPDSYDWVTALPRVLDTNPFDIVVVQLGSNDSQDLRDGNFRFAFGTPDWAGVYQKRVDALIAAARSRSAAIFWVSPPPMAAPDYDQSVAAVAELIRQRVQIANVRYIDIRPAFTAPDGSYTDHSRDETGAIRRLRARNGVHFLRAGNNRLGQLVLAAITADIDASARAAPIDASVPAFGQDGERLTTAGPAAGFPAGAERPPTNSATRLFVDGVVPDPQPGRFDDFSYPAR